MAMVFVLSALMLCIHSPIPTQLHMLSFPLSVSQCFSLIRHQFGSHLESLGHGPRAQSSLLSIRIMQSAFQSPLSFYVIKLSTGSDGCFECQYSLCSAWICSPCDVPAKLTTYFSPELLHTHQYQKRHICATKHFFDSSDCVRFSSCIRTFQFVLLLQAMWCDASQTQKFSGKVPPQWSCFACRMINLGTSTCMPVLPIWKNKTLHPISLINI